MLNSSEIFLLAVLVPLIGAIILSAFQRQFRASSPYLATGFLLLSLAATIFGLVERISHSTANAPPTSHVLTLPWMWLSSQAAPLSPATVAHYANITGDPLTAIMLMTILVLAVPGQIFLMMYLKRDDEPPYFHALICLFVFAAMAACVANSLLALMALAYFAAIVAAVLLAGLARPNRTITAWRSLTMLSTGMACFAIAIAVLNSRTGWSTIGEPFHPVSLMAGVPHLQAVLGVQSSPEILHFRGGPFSAGLNFLTWAGVGFMLSGLALAGQFPFQACPLDTLDAPAPLNGLLTGALLPLLGIYIVARLYPFFTLDARLIMAIAGCTTLATAFLASWAQTDIKHMMWWIIGGQYGWCFLLLGCGAWVQAMEHAILWAALALGLFLVTGMVLRCNGGRRDVRTLGGLWTRLPVTTGAALIFVLIGSQVMNLIVSGDLPQVMLWLHRYGYGLEGFGRLLYWVPLVAVGVNSLALWRWWWLLFGGSSRDSTNSPTVTRESAVLTLPLVVITVLAVGLHTPFFGMSALLAHALPGILSRSENPAIVGTAGTLSRAWQLWIPLAGAIAALVLYFRGMAMADRLRRIPGINLLYIWFHGEFFLREISLVIPGLLLKGLAMAVKFLDRIVLELLLILTAIFLRVTSMVVGRVEQVWSAGIWNQLTAMPMPQSMARLLSSSRVRGGLVLLISAGLVAAAVLISLALA